MSASKASARSIDDYIAKFPGDVQRSLQDIRATIRKAAPDAQETISYKIPTFTLKGKYLVYFAAYKTHIALYPAPVAIAQFKRDLSPYAASKATAKFPLGRPMPLDLIARIIKFRVEENLGRPQAKRDKKPK